MVASNFIWLQMACIRTNEHLVHVLTFSFFLVFCLKKLKPILKMAIGISHEKFTSVHPYYHLYIVLHNAL